MKKVWLLIASILLSGAVQASLLGDLLKSDEPDFLPVEEAFPLTTTLSNGELLASWNSADGYYLYQHRIFLNHAQVRFG